MIKTHYSIPKLVIDGGKNIRKWEYLHEIDDGKEVNVRI